MSFVTGLLGSSFSSNSGQSLWKGPAEIPSQWMFSPCLLEFGRHTQLSRESVCLLRPLEFFMLNQLPLQSAGDSGLVEEDFHILLSSPYYFICCSVKDVLWGPDWEFSLMKN